MRNLLHLVIGLVIAVIGVTYSENAATQAARLQLNWLHDPTFTGEYMLVRDQRQVTIREGGPNLFPLAEVTSGRADIAIVGADIFLQALSKDYQETKDSKLLCIFVDFQRNPVGWILHPDASTKAGLPSMEQNGGAALNKLFFQKVIHGTLQVGDKRGTETTSIWIQWKRLHNVPEDVTVLPVGFDTSIVLGAPMLAYPVYLNEEPFKLTEKIGRPVTVLDPADDGVTLYGNVLVTTRSLAEKKPELISTLQAGLRRSWQQTRNEPSAAFEEVSKYYKGVSPTVLNQQIRKTTDFVFFGTELPGAMDMEEGGRWEQTLNALQQAELVGSHITPAILREHLLRPQ